MPLFNPILRRITKMLKKVSIIIGAIAAAIAAAMAYMKSNPLPVDVPADSTEVVRAVATMLGLG